MFKFAEKRQVWWPVTIKLPIDGGRTEDYEIELRLQLLTRDEMRRIVDGSEVGDTLLADHIVEWRGVSNEQGADLPCNAEIKAALLKQQYIQEAIAKALIAASRGAPAKNL